MRSVRWLCTRRGWRLAAGALAASWVLLPVLLSSCSTLSSTATSPPTIEGATFVGNQICADCHTNIVRRFPASPHGRFYRARGLAMAGTTGCESCHGPGSKHVAAGGGRGKFIVNPGKDPGACFQCHLEISAEFHLPQHHPVVEGKMNCVQCHDPHGSDIFKPTGGLAMARLNETCAQCHRQQCRPFVFEHPALREGCTVCHAIHGSVNAQMLIEPDVNLCLRCHSQLQATPGLVQIGKVDHSTFLRFGTCWNAGCHSSVHGSNVNPKFLY